MLDSSSFLPPSCSVNPPETCKFRSDLGQTLKPFPPNSLDFSKIHQPRKTCFMPVKWVSSDWRDHLHKFSIIVSLGSPVSWTFCEAHLKPYDATITVLRDPSKQFQSLENSFVIDWGDPYKVLMGKTPVHALHLPLLGHWLILSHQEAHHVWFLLEPFSNGGLQVRVPGIKILYCSFIATRSML